MNIQWNAQNYTKDFSFVHEYGQDVLQLIDAPENSFVLDLGCGNGALTNQIQAKGYRVLGMDASDEMLDLARKSHPDLNFQKGNAIDFKLIEQADVIFSNAVFHWIDANDQKKMIQNLFMNLKADGQLVFEFGGVGCAESVHHTLEQIFQKYNLYYLRAFYFPTIGEYAALLEEAGFKVTFAILFDRPTPQRSQNGLIDWINMFDQRPFEGISSELKGQILSEAETALRPILFQNNQWVIDYVRIRMKAIKK